MLLRRGKLADVGTKLRVDGRIVNGDPAEDIYIDTLCESKSAAVEVVADQPLMLEALEGNLIFKDDWHGGTIPPAEKIVPAI